MNNFGEKQKHTEAAGKGKLLKMLAAVALSAAMALSFAACAPNSGGTGSSVETPGTNEPTNPGTNPGTNPSTNPGTNPGTEPSDPGTDPDTDDPYAKYSPALQAVLKSNYYNKQISRATQFGMKDGYELTRNIFGQIPYTFLESEGFDVEELKSDYIYIKSFTYAYEGKTNELYNFVNISYNTDNRYISQYLLKYDDISEQEYKELKMLINGQYIQTGLFVQELNNFHTPHVVSHYNIGYDAYNTILKSLNQTSSIKELIDAKEISAFIVLDVDPNPNNFMFRTRIIGNHSINSVGKTKILDFDVNLYDTAGAYYDNGFFSLFALDGYPSNYSDTSNISLYEFYPDSRTKDFITQSYI